MLCVKTEHPDDPLHTEFFAQLNQLLESSEIQALIKTHPFKDSALSDWIETLGRAGIWSPLEYEGNPFDKAPHKPIADLIHEQPFSLVYRIHDYLPAEQAGTAWFTDMYADALQVDKTIRLSHQTPLSDPLALLDKIPLTDRMNLKLVTSKLPASYESAPNPRYAPPTGPSRPTRTQPEPRTHMEPADAAPLAYRPGDPNTVRYRFKNALRPQFWFILLWTIAGYRENHKYLDPWTGSNVLRQTKPHQQSFTRDSIRPKPPGTSSCIFLDRVLPTGIPNSLLSGHQRCKS